MNELQQNTQPEDKLEGLVKPCIYSKKAIYGFSIFFSPIFGGLLLMQNLKDIEKRKEANIVLWVSILLMAATIIIASFIKVRYIGFIGNIGGAAVLSEYFYKKYFPNEADYEKKKIWKPLIIGTAICVLLILFAFWAQDQIVH